MRCRVDSVDKNKLRPDPLSDELRSTFAGLARPIEKYAGRMVLYEPTPGASKWHEAIVDGEQGPPEAR
jgi:hypothetical protein